MSLTPKTKKLHDPYGALRSRNFGLFTPANFLTFFGSQMVFMTVGWELYGKTSSAMDLGLVGLSLVLPSLALGLLGGNVADRFDRRSIVVLCTIVYTFCLVALGLLSRSPESPQHFRLLIFGLLFLIGTCDAFCIPAKQALVPQLVPPQAIPNAVAWNSTAFQTAAVTGPAVCGYLLRSVSYSTIYWSAALFEIIFIVIILSLRLNPHDLKREPITLLSFAEGARFVWNTKPILATITLDLFAVLLGGCTALLPIFVKDILHSGEETLGWLRTAPAVGALLMAVTVAQVPLKKPGQTLLWAVAGFGLATIVFGLSKNLWLSLSMMFLIGALDNISVIVRGTLVQVLTPDRLLGRVQSVNYLFINSSNELGAFESGLAAAILGSAVPAVVLGGIGSILVALGVSVLWPQVAKLKSLQSQKKL